MRKVVLSNLPPGVVVEEAPQNMAAVDAKWDSMIHKEEDLADAATYQVVTQLVVKHFDGNLIPANCIVTVKIFSLLIWHNSSHVKAPGRTKALTVLGQGLVRLGLYATNNSAFELNTISRY